VAPAKPRTAAAAQRKRRAPAPGTKTEAASSRSPAPSQATAPPAGAGTLELSILPWGEVFVNGKSRGVSPPLRSIEMSPGPHTIEVRNTSFPSHTQSVQVRAGKPVRIRHRFR
jgi:hypothetical protein